MNKGFSNSLGIFEKMLVGLLLLFFLELILEIRAASGFFEARQETSLLDILKEESRKSANKSTSSFTIFDVISLSCVALDDF